jgi:predicted dienelactone hydrolase
MAGHSFGAQTTEAVSGEQFADGSRFKDERIKAALAMSPGVIPGNSPEKAFGNVAIPWFLMTGTEDALPPFGSFMEKSALIFRSLPPGEKYKLILEKGNHFTFAGNRSAEAIDLKSPNHLRSIAVLSTAFWDAYLKNESTAKEWLNGNSPSLILDKEDQWFKK